MSKEQFTPETPSASREYFTKAEAEAKVGQRIKTSVVWAGVPQGTTGRVVAADYMGRSAPANGTPVEQYDVVIQWDLPIEPPRAAIGALAGEVLIVLQPGGPLQDWFTRAEYERWIEEIAPEETTQDTDEPITGAGVRVGRKVERHGSRLTEHIMRTNLAKHDQLIVKLKRESVMYIHSTFPDIIGSLDFLRD